MSERLPRPSSSHLEPPSKGVELEDTGAQESVTSTSDDEHFSDASEGNERAPSHPPSGRTSPVPLTRVEKVDHNPAHGEIPGTPAFEKREQDAVPDEVEIVPDGLRSRASSAAGHMQRPLTPGGSPVPMTVVEKVDLDKPSHGDVPGTEAYEQRKADAVPDVVTTAPDSGTRPSSPSPNSNQPASDEANASEMDVPETVLSRVDSPSSDKTVSGLQAHQSQSSDPLPDVTETVPDVPDSASSPDSSPEQQRDNSNNSEIDGGDHTTENEAVADDFDDFAKGEDMGDDDFGDFDDGFQEPMAEVTEDEPMDQSDMRSSQPPIPPSVPPLVEFDTFQSLSDLYAALDDPLDRLFPASKEISSLPPVEPIQNTSAIFNTERSLSLWSQLVAPPPLQPQNWVKSRIRRLFLVSLGVPVDLDEILPASKQKKLVLPSINIGSDPGGSAAHSRSQSQARRDDTQSGSGSPRTSGQVSRQRTSRRGEPAPPPDLDLSSVRRLCATTDAALGGLTDGELQGHVQDLEHVTLRASSVLEYWLKRRDGLVSEKEAFEGVIENLVSHARRVRK